jgi:hypothetical protein
MGMKRRGCNRGRSVAEKAGVWLEVRHGFASVDVEDLDAMFLCSAKKSQPGSQMRGARVGVLTLQTQVRVRGR